eukprot:1118973-Pleurochrysis_carterae.AAC.1
MPTYPPFPQPEASPSGTTPDATLSGLPLPPSTLPPFVPIVQGQYDIPYFGIRSHLLPLPRRAPEDDASRRCAVRQHRMALEYQRLLDIVDAAAAGRARPPDHPPFARPIPVSLAPSAHGPEGPNRPPDRRAGLCGGRRSRRRGDSGR